MKLIQLQKTHLFFMVHYQQLQLILRFQLFLHPSAIHTAKLLVSLCSKKESIKGPFLKKIKKSNDLHKQQLSVLCSLPGIGEKSAMRILEKFGSPIHCT